MVWNIFISRRPSLSIGEVVKKAANGEWLIIVGGKRVFARPLTDEPISIGSRVRVTGVGSKTSNPTILGAAK